MGNRTTVPRSENPTTAQLFAPTPRCSVASHRPGPFAASVYTATAESGAPRRTLRPGYPEANGPAKGNVLPWVPGISSPEGIIVASSIAVLATGGGEAFIKALESSAQLLVIGITIGIPSAALWIAGGTTAAHPNRPKGVPTPVQTTCCAADRCVSRFGSCWVEPGILVRSFRGPGSPLLRTPRTTLPLGLSGLSQDQTNTWQGTAGMTADEASTGDNATEPHWHTSYVDGVPVERIWWTGTEWDESTRVPVAKGSVRKLQPEHPRLARVARWAAWIALAGSIITAVMLNVGVGVSGPSFLTYIWVGRITIVAWITAAVCVAVFFSTSETGTATSKKAFRTLWIVLAPFAVVALAIVASYPINSWLGR